MPIDLKALQKRGAEVDVTFYGMTSTVVYDPTKFTPGFRTEYGDRATELYAERDAQQAKAREKGDTTFSFRDIYRPNATLLAMLAKSWDIVAIDGKLCPIEAEAILDNLPDQLVSHIITELWEDVNKRGNSQSPSANPSTPTSKATAD